MKKEVCMKLLELLHPSSVHLKTSSLQFHFTGGMNGFLLLRTSMQLMRGLCFYCSLLS